MIESVFKGWSVALLALCLIFLANFLISGQERNTSTSQTEKTLPKTVEERTTTLLILPKAVSLKVTEHKTLSINIDSPEDKIAVLKLQLLFDPSVVKIDSISPGPFFKNASVLHKEINNTQGTVTFVFGSIETKEGIGEVATVRVTGLKSGSAELSISKETEAGAIGKSYNVVKSVSTTKLTVAK